jgi:hypothetical protein
MAISSRLLRYLVLSLLFLFALAPPLRAQSAGYFIDPNSEEPRFIQRLAWSGGEYARRYEVVIEKQEGESYAAHSREFTAEPFIEVSLTAGTYRFRVIPYDILDRPGEGSRWMRLEVRPALRPELFGALQESFNAEDDFYIFKADGKNLLEDSETFFIDQEGGRIAPVRTVSLDDGDSLLLLFDKSQLVTGEYGLVVKNPGGLEAAIDGIVFTVPEKVSKSKAFVKNFGASWMPVLQFPVESVEDSMILSGAAVNMSAAFPLPAGFYIGPELTTTWYSYKSTPAQNSEDDETDSGDEASQNTVQKQALTIGLNVLAGRWFLNHSIAVNLRIGADFALLSEGNVSLNAGASFFWQAISYLYVEAGVNYSMTFDKELSSSLRPWIGAGCQF